MAMLARKRWSTSALLSSAPLEARRSSRLAPGTAKRESPFRFGQEPPSPTLLNLLRGLVLRSMPGLGSNREIVDRRPDGGVGDGAVGSTGTLSHQTQRQRGCHRVLFLFYSDLTPRSRPKGEQKRCKRVADPPWQASHKFSTTEILRTGESVGCASAMPHYHAQNCRKFRLLRVH
jgi:hypothetical protein